MNVRHRFPFTHILIGASAAAIILAGGAATYASNMAFRFVKTLALAGSGAIGDNWTSIPFLNPYRTAEDFCAKTGLVMEGGGTPGATITVVDPSTGAITTGTCGNPSAATVNLVSGWGIKIRQPNVSGARTKIVIVGAHDPSLRISVSPQTVSNPGYWYSVPYNTTAVTFEDLCNEIDLSGCGAARVGGFVRIDAATGWQQTIGCKTVAIKNKLVPGEAIEIINNCPSAKSFVPEVF